MYTVHLQYVGKLKALTDAQGGVGRLKFVFESLEK